MTIIQIQHLLAYLRYYRMPVDGQWGPGSEKACRAFQEDAGLDADGIPGKATQEALRKAVWEGMPFQEDKDEDAAFWAKIRHFTKAEFTCRCGCGLNNIDHRLVLICDDIREKAGSPFVISSPCRCPGNNARAGGVCNSRHLTGRAVDFMLRGRTAQETLSLVRTDGRLAYCYAIDKTYVHIDIL